MKLWNRLFEKNTKKAAQNNDGNSMVLVLVSVALVMLVLSMIFVMMYMQFKMLKLGRQSKDNFYYIEEVLDEIRVGVGNESVQQLKYAYDDTVAMVVYYDTHQQKYMSVSSETAENIMDNKFFNNIDKTFNIGNADLQSKLLSYVKNYDASNNCVNIYAEDVSGNVKQLAPATISFGTDFKLKKITSKSPVTTLGYSITDITVSRVDEKGNDQSITTDITIYPPEEAMNFLGTGSDLENIFTYAMVADYGVVIGATPTDAGTLAEQQSNVRVAGNMYAAKDTRNNGIYGATVSGSVAASGEESLTLANSKVGGTGTTDDSLYSGLFVTGPGTYLNLQSDIVSVSGSIAANRGAEINSNKKNSHRTNTAMSTVWAENIVTTGKLDAKSGPKIHLNAQACLSDDLELNADYSDVALDGVFIGYNYDSVDEMSGVTSEFDDPLTKTKRKSHTKSSAIVINGKHSSLDMTELSKLIVSGKSYIDMVGSNAVKNDKTTDYDIRTGESIMTKGTQLVYRVLESMDIDSTLPVIRDIKTVKTGDSAEGKEKVTDDRVKVSGTQTLTTPVPTYYMGKFLMYQFFKKKGYEIYKDKADDFNAKYKSWSTVTEDTYKKAWGDLSSYGTASSYYPMLQDIMAFYFPTGNAIESTISDSGVISYAKNANDTTEVTDCYGNKYTIPKNEGTVAISTSLNTTTGKYEAATSLSRYGFITAGADNNLINLVKTTVSSGNATDPDYNDYYYYQFYDEASKEQFILDFAAYTADKDTQKELGYSIKDVTSLDLFDSSLVTLPDEKSGAKYYTRGVTTVLEANATSYKLIPSKKSTLNMDTTDVMTLYDEKVEMAKVFKCYFPKSETYVTQSHKDIAEELYSAGQRTADGKVTYTNTQNLAIAGDNISPLTNPDCININWKLVKEKNLKGVELTGYPGAKVWVSDEDLVIDGKSKEKIKGIVLCQGNVTLKDVSQFTGTIICAGKLYIVGNTEFYTDEQMCNTMIQNDTDNQIRTCFFLPALVEDNDDDAVGVSVSSIKYTDIVGYANWKKNAK